MHHFVHAFANNIRSGLIDIYNEISFQHELGLFLRLQNIGQVHFERHISHFNFDKKEFPKREIDLTLSDTQTKKLFAAIELKYPRNGQYPEQMFSFCKDICFIEQLKKAGFPQAFLIIIVDDPLFYSGASTGIYSHFRGQNPINGVIVKPTGKKDEKIYIAGSYQVNWHNIDKKMKYALIEAQ